MLRAIASTVARAVKAYTRCPNCEQLEQHLAELGTAYNKAEVDKGAMMRTASAQGVQLVELRTELAQEQRRVEQYQLKWKAAQDELNRILRNNPNAGKR